MFERGKLILIPFPFTDLSASKVRPAVIISDPQYTDKDVSVLFISSRISKKTGPMDHTIKPADPHFEETGLKVPSLIKCNKVATLDKKIVLGEMGTLHQSDQKKIDKKLKLALGL
jgi:mRNA interferase MazF